MLVCNSSSACLGVACMAYAMSCAALQVPGKAGCYTLLWHHAAQRMYEQRTLALEGSRALLDHEHLLTLIQHKASHASLQAYPSSAPGLFHENPVHARLRPKDFADSLEQLSALCMPGQLNAAIQYEAARTRIAERAWVVGACLVGCVGR